MTLATERQQFAAQNEMSMEFVNWFFDEKKDGCGNAWFIMAAAMWEGWKGRDDREAQPVASREHFENLCNKFWNWAEFDMINDGEEEPILRWDGKNYTHRVTAALWRMYQAAQPVVWWTGPEPTPTGEREGFHDHETGSHSIPLYTAPPAPACANAVAWEMRYWNSGYGCWSDWERITEEQHTKMSARHATDNDYELRVLYDAPTAPAVPNEAYSDDCPDLYPSQPDAWASGWNACRAAMLNHVDDTIEKAQSSITKTRQEIVNDFEMGARLTKHRFSLDGKSTAPEGGNGA